MKFGQLLTNIIARLPYLLRKIFGNTCIISLVKQEKYYSAKIMQKIRKGY